MVTQTNNPVCGSMVELMFMEVSTLVRCSNAFPTKSSGLHSEESLGLLPHHPLMGGIRERILNPVFSLASVKDLVSCV